MAKLPTKTKLKDFALENETLSKVVSSAKKAKVEVEIGDAKQPDFKPQFKLKKWDNSVNFSIRAEEDPTATTAVEDGKIKYKSKKHEVHMYELDADNFEFEWVFDKKPDSNVLTATIQTKGLVFYPQPALTQEEIDAGWYRPEDIIDSIAVHHDSKRNNVMYETDDSQYTQAEIDELIAQCYAKYEKGKFYELDQDIKSGKAFHIKRVVFIDGDGNKHWGTQEVDVDNGLYKAIIPLDVYNDKKTNWKGARLDPTFGVDPESPGASYGNGFGKTTYTEAVLSEDGDLTQLSVYIDWNFSGSGTFNTAIYSDSSGANSKLATATAISKSNGVAWEDTPISYSATAGTFWLAESDGSGSANYRWYYDTGVSGDSDSDTTYTILPSTASLSGTLTNYLWSIYATYTASGGTYSLTADVGSFAVTGQAATLQASRKLSAEAGSFSVTGQPATFQITRKLTADAGSFTLTGNDATLVYNSGTVCSLLQENGDALLQENGDAILLESCEDGGGGGAYTLTAGAGSFVLTGNDVTLQVTRKLTADAGSYTITGQDTTLQYSRKLTLDAGSFTLTGLEATFNKSGALVLETGVFVLTGNDVGLSVTRKLDAGVGSYTLTGLDATLTYTEAGYSIELGIGEFTITGQDVEFTYSGSGKWTNVSKSSQVFQWTDPDY